MRDNGISWPYIFGLQSHARHAYREVWNQLVYMVYYSFEMKPRMSRGRAPSPADNDFYQDQSTDVQRQKHPNTVPLARVGL